MTIPMGEPWADDPAPTDLPDDLLARIKPELAPDERLLWASRSGQPAGPTRPGGCAMAGAWSGGLLVLGFSAVVLSLRFSGPLRPAGENLLMAIGVMAGSVGSVIGLLALISLPSAVRGRRLRRGRVYALTDRRAIVWSPVAGSEAVTVHVYPRGSIRPEQIERTQFPDGSGTLAFQGLYAPGGRFEGIADVRRVEDLVRRYLVALGPGPTP